MSGKLDQSLDEILSTNKSAVRGKGRLNRRGRRAPQAGRATAVVAPVGGIKKNPKPKVPPRLFPRVLQVELVIVRYKSATW